MSWMKIIGQGRKIEKWPPAVLLSMGNGQPPVLIGCMLYYPNESKTMRRTIFQTRTIFRQQFVWFSNKGSKKDPWYVDCGERGS